MISWQYLAGFIDGDGWVTRCTGRFPKWEIGLTQKATERPFMELVQSFLTDNQVRSFCFDRVVSSPRIPVPVNMISLCVREQAGLAVALENLVPHLVLKRERAVLALEWVKSRLFQRGIGQPDAREFQPTNVYWTEEEKRELFRLHAEGHSNKSIAVKLNRSIGSVSHKLSRAGKRRGDRPLSINDDILAKIANEP